MKKKATESGKQLRSMEKRYKALERDIASAKEVTHSVAINEILI